MTMNAKKIFQKIELPIFLLIFVLPAIFWQIAGFFQKAEPPKEIRATYPISIFAISFLLILICKSKIPFFSPTPWKNWKKETKISVFANSQICFGTLFLISAAFEFLGRIANIQSETKIIPPDDFFSSINFFLGTILAAFSEEFIFRIYLPEKFSAIFPKSKFFFLSKEAIPLILFSLGHIHLGILGVFNALFCGISLRICIAKTRSIAANTAVHSLYNFLAYILFWLL